jgi:quercetin dioxygenase-like cupin family protein
VQTFFLEPGKGESLWVAIDLVTFKATGAETAGAFASFETTVPPGGGTPPHSHEREDEHFFVLEGEVEFRVDGASCTGRPGTWVSLPRGSKHHFSNPTSKPARMLILAIPAGIEDFFRAVGVASEHAPPMTPERIGRLVSTAAQYGIHIEVPPPDAG